MTEAPDRAAIERAFWLGRSCGGSKAEIDAALAQALEHAPDAMADARVVALVEAVEAWLECDDPAIADQIMTTLYAALEAAKGADT